MKITTELLMLFMTMLGMFLTILFTLVGAVWYLATRFNRYVTHSVCETRRMQCPCWSEIEHLKEDIEKL
jgi:hypothetical protein